ncbi:MazG-like family protein [Brevundimonas diminuta]|uniref:MazG-like family protein n=1 Tax=Brevundimonas diminuta TaxID=293 RepID=UPI003F7D4176
MSDSLNIQTSLRAANIARQAEWDPSDKITLTYRLNELAGETGEACNVGKKIERERLGIRGSRDTIEHLAEELGDVVICADLVAMAEGIDLEAAVAAKFNATSEKVGLKTRLAAPAAPFDRDGLIALIMEETTDDIVADGWDRLGKPNVLVQGCRYIRRNAPPSPEGYANPEASAKQFAGFIADRILKALATREEAPAEAGEDGRLNVVASMLERVVGSTTLRIYEPEAKLILSAIRAQPQARKDAQPVDATWHYTKDCPAPDALRVAVEALEKIRLQSEDCLGVRMETITAIADAALTTLQAEQKGGA